MRLLLITIDNVLIFCMVIFTVDQKHIILAQMEPHKPQPQPNMQKANKPCTLTYQMFTDPSEVSA